MAKYYFHRKPYLTTLVAIGLLTVFEFIFFTQTVLAQGQTVENSYDPVKIASIAVLIFNGVGFLAAFAWYIVRGKSNDQLTKNNQDLLTSNSELRAQKADRDKEIAELKAELKDVERENVRLRKANLRLQGLEEE